MGRKRGLKQVGVTNDGRAVRDVFDAVDTHGISLNLVLQFAHEHEHEFVIGWGVFWERAVAVGWNVERKVREVEQAVTEEFGSEYAAEWRKRTDAYLQVCLSRRSRD